VIAAATAGVGLLTIVSALTPSVASRSEMIASVLPPVVPEAARLAALGSGLGLIWLSRSLGRRQQRAWLLAVALVVATATAHLVKGLDFEEATASALVCAALIRYRRRFDVPGDPAALKPLLATVFALASAGGFLTLYALHRLQAPEDLEDLVTGAVVVFGARSLYLWLRPWSEAVHVSVAQRRLAHRLVSRYGRDSLAFFALRQDKSYFFSPSSDAFLAYRVVGGSALISGDPIGDRAEFPALVEEFRRVAHARGWRLAVLGASGELMPLYRSLGLRVVKLGDEAVVRPAEFSLEGRPIRKVRQSVHRLRRAGYRVRVLSAEQIDSLFRAELDAVSDEWLGGWPERGFTMAMDDLYSAAEPVFAVAEDSQGRIGGFLHLVPMPAARGYSVGAMRRRRATPNGLMEFLIAEALVWAERERVSQVSLNFCVFADLLRTERDCSRVGRVVGFALLKLDRIFQLKRLLTFSDKFLPEWEPRYVCFERFADVPGVSLAYLRLESLLTPPGPWTKRLRTATGRG